LGYRKKNIFRRAKVLSRLARLQNQGSSYHIL
jgi:hypothetical protein